MAFCAYANLGLVRYIYCTDLVSNDMEDAQACKVTLLGFNLVTSFMLYMLLSFLSIVWSISGCVYALLMVHKKFITC